MVGLLSGNIKDERGLKLFAASLWHIVIGSFGYLFKDIYRLVVVRQSGVPCVTLTW